MVVLIKLSRIVTAKLKHCDYGDGEDDDGDDPNKSGDDDHVYVYHRHGDATPADTPTVTIIINGIYCISDPVSLPQGG